MSDYKILANEVKDLFLIRYLTNGKKAYSVKYKLLQIYFYNIEDAANFYITLVDAVRGNF